MERDACISNIQSAKLNNVEDDIVRSPVFYTGCKLQCFKREVEAWQRVTNVAKKKQ